MRAPLRAIVAFALVAAGCRPGQVGPPPSGGSPGSVTGSVIETSTNRKLSGAFVALTGRDTTGGSADGYSTSTRNDGSFQFDRVRPGDYTLSASSPGYQSDAIDIRVYPSTGKRYVLTLSQVNSRCPVVVAGKAPVCK